jgi:ferredoxin/flavodoxin---NADP+ reductase
MFHMPQLGTEANPLRVAIIGSGPSAFYAADDLQQKNGVVQIDMYERLVSPHGLVRGGVAPDHPKIKTVSKVYDRIASNPNFRYYGNVEFGKHITHAEMLTYYNQIIYAVGAQTDKHMGIPGEDLPGSLPATEFVGWYNAHPDYRHFTFDLTQESAVVVGNGNVAMDVVRILASTYEELVRTDIADYALAELKNSRVKHIWLLGRRGPVQASFTNPELKELGLLEGADVEVLPADMELDSFSREEVMAGTNRDAERNLQTLMRYSNTPYGTKPRIIHIRFLASPEEITGKDHVEAVKVVKNELYKSDDGSVRPRPTDQIEIIPAGLVFRSIGYKGVPLPDVPFDDRKGVIPNDKGRVVDPKTKQPVLGEYAVGWIKRGPSGIIGTNKPDSQGTVEMMLEDYHAGRTLQPAHPEREAVEALLHQRQPNMVSYQDWLVIDQIEQERGKALGRPRLKFDSSEQMLAALAERKVAPVPNSGD